MYAAHNGNVTFLNDVNAQTRIQDTSDAALILAVRNHAFECVKRLIAVGAGLNKRGQNGNTALVEAIEANDDRCVKLLIKSGADVNIKKGFKVAALFSAAEKCYLHYIEQLIEAGADVNYRPSILLFFKAKKRYIENLSHCLERELPSTLHLHIF